MVLVSAGLLMLVFAFLLVRFPLLAEALRQHHSQLWLQLGRPEPWSFHQSLGLFSWVLARGFDQTPGLLILGEQALVRARWARSLFVVGFGCLVLGYFWALLA
ncbi:hypothetical protein [Simiduia agarivorans]|uniref:Uncharacterized protein n=1 Tax=Simiduia agarivorans (strain DSM 21679 / JCM 13881 / BCRC 17597 / SA1) TaxID=1117647 RepID=K4KI19_SIMAS|nr:hypothetical protein [Simiduia agarivorans]AFU98769.1 hypothetical protein M5M_07900 [Simiduia agarivorans SA1 = DSM 21679]